MKLARETTVKVNSSQANIVGHLCYAASKLWNVCLYERRHWQTLGLTEYPDWYVQKKDHKRDLWFKNLPSQTAQEILKRLDGAYKSYRTLRKSGGIQNPRPPRFKQDPISVPYMQNGMRIDKGSGRVRLTLPKALKSHLKEKYGIREQYLWIENDLFSEFDAVKQIVLYPPENGECRIVIIYEISDEPVLADNGHYLSIDTGLHNLLTCFDSEGHTFIAGREYLSICRNGHRKVSRVQSQWYGQQAKQGVRFPKSSVHIKELYDTKRHCEKDYLHKVTHAIAEYCAANGITRVVVGDLTGLRKDKNYGHITNQQFHAWPFRTLTLMLRYKLVMRGILLIQRSEAYTSQCSPLAPKVCKEFATPQKRVSRGLYKDGGMIWNADAVGAFNLMRRWLSMEHPDRTLSADLIRHAPVVMKVAV